MKRNDKKNKTGNPQQDPLSSGLPQLSSNPFLSGFIINKLFVS